MKDHDDIPELSSKDFSRAKSFKKTFPRQYKSWKKRGRPPVAKPKIHIGFRLAPDVVKGVKASGKGYNARVEKVLRDALSDGKL